MNLLLPLNWVVEGSFEEVLAKCLLICPGIPQLLGLVFESRWVPWNPKYQFRAFMPGNPALAMFIAGCSTAFDQLGDEGFWQSTGLHQAVLVSAFVIYVSLNIMDLQSNYTRRQMASATKVYHNSLYFWYSYVAVIAAIALLTSEASVLHKVVVLLPGLFWLGCLFVDSFFTSKEVLDVRFKTAHTSNEPLWKTGWKLRRRTKEGYTLAA